MILSLLLFASLLAIAETYAFFPWRMMRKSNDFTERGEDPEVWPEVALLLAAYNEEAVMEEKLKSMLNSDYPADKIRIVVGSDRSSDRTDEIVKQFAASDARVQLRRFEERTGKPAIINQLVSESQETILVLSDADTFFEPHTLKALVRPFSDAKVGGVQAKFISKADGENNVARQELVYNDRELMLKRGESVDGAVIGAYGACYALRRAVYVPVPAGFLVDDFYIFMKVLEQGYQTVLSDAATCLLELSGASEVEFKRKTRIGKGNFQNFFALKKFQNPFTGKVATYYWSHKVLRWFTPFLLLIAFFSNLALIGEDRLYVSLFATQCFGYALAILDIPLRWMNIHIAPIRFISHFLSMNIALFLGFLQYLQGKGNGTWK
ncbi:MAG: glycosyltransferase [Bacteroidetes bacterium]|nr:MAG: glycosyltransferase [Bacteroidota bacterium]